MDERIEDAKIVLLVTTVPGAENLAAALSEGAGVVLEVAKSRRAALAALRRMNFASVIVDVTLPANEVTSTEMLWQNAGGAVPLEVDVRALGTAALIRLVRSVLDRRNQMEALVREDVTRSMAEELRSTVTGMLLQSDLALRDRTLSPAIEQRVLRLRALADDLRSRLRAA